MADEVSGAPGPEGPVPDRLAGSGKADGGEARSRYGITRRQMLTGGAATSLAAVLAGYPDGPARLLTALARDVGGIPIQRQQVPQTFTFSVEREADLALLDITFHGFLLNYGPGSVTSLVPASSSNVIVVQLPPQAIGEAIYTYAADGHEPDWVVDPPPVMSAVSGPSRLCFTLNTGQQVDFTTMTAADLLDWSSWTLLVPAVAQVDEGGVEGGVGIFREPFDRTAGNTARLPDARPDSSPPAKPGEFVTSIEYPYAVFLAPTVDIGGAFFGFTTKFNGRTEPLVGEHQAGSPTTGISDLWTTALEVTTYDRDRLEFQYRGVEYSSPPPPPRKPQVAAIYARDYESGVGTEGATPWTEINYEPFPPPQIRRRAKPSTAGIQTGAPTSPTNVSGTSPTTGTGAAVTRSKALVTRSKKSGAKRRRMARRRRHQRGDRRS